jgi:hypothetical protein
LKGFIEGRNSKIKNSGSHPQFLLSLYGHPLFNYYFSQSKKLRVKSWILNLIGTDARYQIARLATQPSKRDSTWSLQSE